MSDVVGKIQKELEAFNAKRMELVEELRKEFPQLFSSLFNQSKRIESVGWTQYTPYFNDGEECEFSVHLKDLDELLINGKRLWDFDDEGDFISLRLGYPSEPNPNLDQFEHDLLNDIHTVLNQITEDFYKDLFGDHCQVTIYKDGRIQVDEYEHD